jgi:hypothetical protein
MPSRTIDTTVDINASKDAVWDVLTDFARYEEWNPTMRIEGAPEVGTTAVVHLASGVTFKPKVLAATPDREFAMARYARVPRDCRRRALLRPHTHDDGTTRLNHGERFSGALVALALDAA